MLRAYKVPDTRSQRFLNKRKIHFARILIEDHRGPGHKRMVSGFKHASSVRVRSLGRDIHTNAFPRCGVGFGDHNPEVLRVIAALGQQERIAALERQ